MLTRTCSYVPQCARARVTSTDKYGKTSQERDGGGFRRFVSLPKIPIRSASIIAYLSKIKGEVFVIVRRAVAESTNQKNLRMDEPRPFNPDPLVCIISRAALQQLHGEKGSRKLCYKG